MSGIEKLKNALVADGYDVEVRYKDIDNHDAILVEVPGAKDYTVLFLTHACEVSDEKIKEAFEHVYETIGKAVQ